MRTIHTILSIAQKLITELEVHYHELTDEAYCLTDRNRRKFQLLKRLQSLGVKVQVVDEAAYPSYFRRS